MPHPDVRPSEVGKIRLPRHMACSFVDNGVRHVHAITETKTGSDMLGEMSFENVVLGSSASPGKEEQG